MISKKPSKTFQHMGNKMKIILIQSLDESVFKYKVCSFQPALNCVIRCLQNSLIYFPLSNLCRKMTTLEWMDGNIGNSLPTGSSRDNWKKVRNGRRRKKVGKENARRRDCPRRLEFWMTPLSTDATLREFSNISQSELIGSQRARTCDTNWGN